EAASVTNVITLQNLSPLELAGLSATVVEKPANLNVTVSTPASIPGDSSVNLTYSIHANDASVPFGTVHLRVTVSAGVTNDMFVYVTVEALRPRLVANPDTVRAGMKRGAQTFVEFSVANIGGSNTGPLTVLAPNVPWLRIA